MSQKENSVLINQDRSLIDLLKAAPHEELSALADIITDHGKGRALLKEADNDQ